MGAGDHPLADRGTSRRGAVAVDWHAVERELADRDVRDELGPSELELLADAHFWLDRQTEALAIRRRAYTAHVDAGDTEAAALTAWRMFYEHVLVGETSVANGWLARCRRHAADDGGPRSGGWLAVAEADLAAGAGDHAASAARFAEAGAAGHATGDRDLVAMALQGEGRAHVMLGDRRRGLSLLDESMVAVVNDEVAPMYTGWIFCNVVATCYGIADLRRAGEWSDAAMRWCAHLRDGRIWKGLCRVYAVELACLRGHWEHAEREAELACDELTHHDERYAGTAYYLVGDLRRRRGDLAGAAAAFTRAHELGHLAQPGLALMYGAQGRTADGLAALSHLVDPGPQEPLPRAMVLAALAQLAAGAGDRAAVDRAAAEIGRMVDDESGPVITAFRDAVRAHRAQVHGDHDVAIAAARAALAGFLGVGMPYEAAEARRQIAAAADAAGDADTARRELAAARAALAALGVTEHGTTPSGDGPVGAPLTERELQVLAEVAAGRTNREIADRLRLSPHTVARHVSNILSKLGAGSRAAATALAYERGWLGTPTSRASPPDVPSPEITS